MDYAKREEKKEIDLWISPKAGEIMRWIYGFREAGEN